MDARSRARPLRPRALRRSLRRPERRTLLSRDVMTRARRDKVRRGGFRVSRDIMTRRRVVQEPRTARDLVRQSSDDARVRWLRSHWSERRRNSTPSGVKRRCTVWVVVVHSQRRAPPSIWAVGSPSVADSRSRHDVMSASPRRTSTLFTPPLDPRVNAKSFARDAVSSQMKCGSTTAIRPLCRWHRISASCIPAPISGHRGLAIVSRSRSRSAEARVCSPPPPSRAPAATRSDGQPCATSQSARTAPDERAE